MIFNKVSRFVVVYDNKVIIPLSQEHGYGFTISDSKTSSDNFITGRFVLPVQNDNVAKTIHVMLTNALPWLKSFMEKAIATAFEENDSDLKKLCLDFYNSAAAVVCEDYMSNVPNIEKASFQSLLYRIDGSVSCQEFISVYSKSMSEVYRTGYANSVDEIPDKIVNGLSGLFSRHTYQENVILKSGANGVFFDNNVTWGQKEITTALLVAAHLEKTPVDDLINMMKSLNLANSFSVMSRKSYGFGYSEVYENDTLFKDIVPYIKLKERLNAGKKTKP